MFSIAREDLAKFERIGKGKYGHVYKIDSDNVIKVYRDTIKNKVGELVINPALKVSRGRLKRIKKEQEKLITQNYLEILL